MVKGYGGLYSNQTNNPVGFYREEIVKCYHSNRLVVNGCPIQSFVDPSYRHTYETTPGAPTYVYKWGVIRIYDITGTAEIPTSNIDAISPEGFIIYVASGQLTVGSLYKVCYYARSAGTQPALRACQAGDKLYRDFMDAAIQKVNDAPPLRWAFNENPSYWYYRLAYNTAWGASCIKLSTTTGTWATTNTPLYVTALELMWGGDTMDGRTDSIDILIDIDGQTQTVTLEGVPDFDRDPDDTMHLESWYELSANQTDFTEGAIVPLGLVEVKGEIDIDVNVNLLSPTDYFVAIMGYGIP